MDTLTINTYNESAKEYEIKAKNYWDQNPRTFIDKFTNLVKGKVLDLGSGPGRDALIFKERGISVVCLDASIAMINLCKEKKLEVVLGNFESIPFENNYFFGVWAYTSLLHINKAKILEIINEIKRVLNDNGIFGLSLIEGEGEGYRDSTYVKKPRWFSFYKKEEIEIILKTLEFEIIYFEKIETDSKNYLNFISRKSLVSTKIHSH